MTTLIKITKVDVERLVAQRNMMVDELERMQKRWTLLNDLIEGIQQLQQKQLELKALDHAIRNPAR